jgi:serine/threonine protein kinase
MADRVGQQLGNYRLLRLLGRGGFAEVYLGEHLYLKSWAALKVLHTQLTDEDAQRFVQEAQTLARLSHPHIVRVLDFAVHEGLPFLVMEYAPGGTLRTRHPRQTRLPLDTIVVYVNQVAQALQFAHDHRLIHRDVKPENMLLGSRDDVLLSDFGHACPPYPLRQYSSHSREGRGYFSLPGS